MADDEQGDPGARFREMITQWERNFDSEANRVMGTEAFSAWMNQMQNAQIGAQKAFSDFMTQPLTQLNMPTREDVIRIGEAVRDLGIRLERVEQMLATLAGTAGAKKTNRPARTRKPASTSAGAAKASTKQGGDRE